MKLFDRGSLPPSHPGDEGDELTVSALEKLEKQLRGGLDGDC